MINTGVQQLLIKETKLAGGVTVKEEAIRSDALLITLWVSSISGTLDVSVTQLTDDGKESGLVSFPTLSATTAILLTKKSGVTLSRFKVTAAYSAACSYEIYVRPIESAGDSTTKLLGQSTLTATQITVSTSPVLLIPAALTDRAGLIIRNWNQTTGVLYVAESGAADLTTTAYPVGPTEALSIDLASGAAVYGVSDSGSIDVRILQAGG